MEDLGDCSKMAGKVAFGSLRNTLPALKMVSASSPIMNPCPRTNPSDEDIFRQSSIWVLDFDKSELNAAFREVLDEIYKLPLFDGIC